jgi:GTP cyclohydrolase I
MQVQERVRKFIGPVKHVYSALTELEDGSLYISAEQLETMMAGIKKHNPQNFADFVLGMLIGTQLARREKK